MSFTVAIVGRPNVGKSTLFNRLVGKKLALVDDQPGVTRDRREGQANLLGVDFTIIDTAGYEDEDPQTLPGRMRLQTQAAVESADVALFLMDARAGVTPLDEEIAGWLREGDLPVVLVANKAEGRQGNDGVMEAFSLGLGEPVPLSAEHGQGMADLFQALLPYVDREEEEVEEAEPSEADLEAAPLKLAIVGRPNAGKSTLINRLLGENRLLTGPEAGITRDSIAVDWKWTSPDGEERAKVQDKLEKLAVSDGLNAVNFAEVVVLLLDSTRGLEAQDLRIADKVIEEGRALVVALNKWDTVENGSALYRRSHHDRLGRHG
jgi:GTP-binding protein